MSRYALADTTYECGGHRISADILQNYQKDAILRQMKEYKRRAKDVEEQFKELQEKTKYHEDNLRSVNAFFDQTIDEVRVLIHELPPAPGASATGMRPIYAV